MNDKPIMLFKQKNISEHPWILAMLFLVVFIALVGIVYWRLPVKGDYREGVFALGVDWKGTYRPAALALLRGENPYHYGLQNPAWILLPLIPVALLSQELGAAVMFAAGFFVYGFIGYKLRLRWWAISLLLINPMTIACFTNGNTDWLTLLGFVFPPQIGLFFLVLKPQLTLGALVFLLVEAWRKGSWRQVLIDFAPVSMALLITFLVWGFWPAKLYGDRMADSANASLFPTLLPVGLVLLFQAVRSRNIKPAIISSVFLSPYLTYHGYAAALLGLDSASLVIASASAWIVWLLPLFK